MADGTDPAWENWADVPLQPGAVANPGGHLQFNPNQGPWGAVRRDPNWPSWIVTIKPPVRPY